MKTKNLADIEFENLRAEHVHWISSVVGLTRWVRLSEQEKRAEWLHITKAYALEKCPNCLEQVHHIDMTTYDDKNMCEGCAESYDRESFGDY